MNGRSRRLLPALLLASWIGATPLPAAPVFGSRPLNGYLELLTADRQDALTWPQPKFAVDPAKAREGCAVVLRVFFSAEGKAERVTIEARVGSVAIAELAAKSAREQLRLPPQLAEGKPVRFYWDLPMYFLLESSPDLKQGVEKHLRRGGDRRQNAVDAIRALAAERGTAARK